MRLARAVRHRAISGLAAVPAFRRDLGEIHRLVTDPELSLPCHPGEPRKTRARMLTDLLLWRVRRGAVLRFFPAALSLASTGPATQRRSCSRAVHGS